ncbi:MAG: small-conductance mechanosensitive channel [Chlamydiales bacterium]|jgi:small-conductance mechanosensitive channel
MDQITVFLAVGTGVANAGAVLLTVYLCAILLKRSHSLPGQLGQIPAALALLLLPLSLVGWFVHDGDLLAMLARSDLNQDAARWWVLPIAREGAPDVTVNLLGAGVIIAALFIVTTLLVELGSALYARRHETGWLSIHKALVKWPIVLVGCLIALKIDVGTILLGTSVAVVGIGFVLKETLENLFTGMSLEVEGTARRGDWISHGGDTGIVYEKTWRATKIRTLADVSITIPNRLLGMEKVQNYNRPKVPHARLLCVGASYNDPPVRVKEILRSILIRQPLVLSSPEPSVRTIAYEDFSITYEMKFWIRDFARHRPIEERILTHIWYAFRFYGVEIPFPIRTVHMKEREQLEAEERAIESGVESRLEFVGAHGLFGRLPRKDLDFLSRNAFRRRYEPMEQVIRAGEIGDALYLVQEGWCEAVLPDGKRPRIDPGRYFGEMGLLATGARTVDVVAGEDGALVLRVDKHCMEVLFEAHPDLRKDFVKVGLERRRELPVLGQGASAPRESGLSRVWRIGIDILRPW